MMSQIHVTIDQFFSAILFVAFTQARLRFEIAAEQHRLSVLASRADQERAPDSRSIDDGASAGMQANELTADASLLARAASRVFARCGVARAWRTWMMHTAIATAIAIKPADLSTSSSGRNALEQLEAQISSLKHEAVVRRACALLVRGLADAQAIAWHTWRDVLEKARLSALLESHTAALRANDVRHGLHRAAGLIASASMRVNLRAWRCWIAAVSDFGHDSAIEHHQIELKRVKTNAAMRRAVDMLVHRASYLQQMAWQCWLRLIEQGHIHGLLKAQREASIREGMHRAASLMTSAHLRGKQRVWRCWIKAVNAHFRNTASEVSQAKLERVKAEHHARFVREGICRTENLMASAALRSKQRAWRCWIQFVFACSRDFANEQHLADLRRIKVEATVRRAGDMLFNRAVHLQQMAWQFWKRFIEQGHIIGLLKAQQEASMREGMHRAATLVSSASLRLSSATKLLQQRHERCWIRRVPLDSSCAARCIPSRIDASCCALSRPIICPCSIKRLQNCHAICCKWTARLKSISPARRTVASTLMRRSPARCCSFANSRPWAKTS